MLKRIPFHPLFFAIYPALALLAHNIREVEVGAALRPLALSIAITAGIFLLLSLILNSWYRGGFLTTLLLVLFYSYGHLYGYLEGITLLGLSVGRHRYLLAAWFALLAAGGWWSARKQKDASPGTSTRGLWEFPRGEYRAGVGDTATGILNLVSLLLLIFPLYQLAAYQIGEARAEASLSRQGNAQAGSLPAHPVPLTEMSELPDIYYIVLDGYARADFLQNVLGFDNDPFLDELRGMGFYIADCSRSNYRNTLKSLTSSLNMEYLHTLVESVKDGDEVMEHLWVALKYNRVIAQLKAQGYKTVAFDTGYEWSRLENADYYLGLKQRSYELQNITEFEAMLAKSTALLALIESADKVLVDRFMPVNYPYSENIGRHRFILDAIPRVASNPEPTFLFAHVLVTHPPYVFGPDGEFLTDTGYYGKHGYPVNEEYAARGYLGTIQYSNGRLLEIIRQILAQSNTGGVPPVIILQADHGLREEQQNQGLRVEQRHSILNAYYLSGTGKEQLYSNITPVNTFRVVFNTYFKAGSKDSQGMSLLPDVSYDNHVPPRPVPETSPQCK
jgi:hypothetical protein